ncbi:dipeptide ABC transporter ATP-binding protein [Veronia nyctiphanis]|uniref:Dipeptide ABC transporter ATP-binding protein n=1 Tax=Veronia nyctiphanis TaxID=1278244 RepID=A0A4Q0YSN9_9GAMM|nr:oligopeptide/dipeptide ABC transporter ATP-binding protein [Veronia nyctiphanis]RXJ74232.1 dipeptide ABC transporter ATP-binding protein [Veronia nyctiphanis]
MTLVKLTNVCQRYPVGKKDFFGKSTQTLHAVKDVSLTIDEAETVAVVGESGCGKSTLGRIVSLLESPKDGELEIAGVDPRTLSKNELKELRKKLGLVFQDPFSALNPRMPISQLVAEPLEVYNIGTQAQRQAKVLECLKAVGLSEDALDRYPHEFSGGQRQRICIARALVLDPKLIIADEPLSALDVSVQSQILNLFTELKQTRNLSFFFISHDMAVVDYLADTIVVMYLGQVVESAPRTEFFTNPAHPYSRALLNAVPEVGTGRRKKGLALQGDVPSPINPPAGCPFNPRCSKATDLCRTEKPASAPVSESNSHTVSCHFPEVAAHTEVTVDREVVTQ